MVERASKADQCGFINPKFGQSSPFYECTREYRSLAAELYTSCEFDVCAYFEDPKTRHDAICSSLEALEAECEFAGFNIRWRTPDFCRTYHTICLSTSTKLELTKRLIRWVRQ